MRKHYLIFDFNQSLMNIVMCVLLYNAPKLIFFIRVIRKCNLNTWGDSSDVITSMIEDLVRYHQLVDNKLLVVRTYAYFQQSILKLKIPNLYHDYCPKLLGVC